MDNLLGSPRHIEVKRALKKANLTETFIIGKYGYSPYQACGHGCKYCDGRAEKYYVEGDFERDIVVRKNLPDLLAQELASVREKGFVAGGSGVSDIYQPVEAEERIMEKVSEIISRSSLPAVVATKSALAARDRKNWLEVNRKSCFLLLISLTFTDDRLREIFEPGASSVEERLELINSFKQAGCRVGALAMPFLPHISDDEKNMATLFGKFKEIGVDCVLPGDLTLRPGCQKELFFKTLEKHFPHLIPLYEEIYRENRASGASIYSHRKKIYPLFLKYLTQFGFNPQIPHYIYKPYLHNYDSLNLLFQHMILLYDYRGIKTAPLKQAYGRFYEWLDRVKGGYNRHRSWLFSSLEEELLDMVKSDRMEKLLGNKKLSDFTKKVVLEDYVFDYSSLKLRSSE